MAYSLSAIRGGGPFPDPSMARYGTPSFLGGPRNEKRKSTTPPAAISRPPFGMTMAAIHDKVAQQGRGDHRELTATGRRTNER
jgi:hypothetical protein